MIPGILKTWVMLVCIPFYEILKIVTICSISKYPIFHTICISILKDRCLEILFLAQGRLAQKNLRLFIVMFKSGFAL